MAEDLKNLIIELLNELIQYEQRVANMLQEDIGDDELPEWVFEPGENDFSTRVNQALAKRAIQIEMGLVMTILNTSILDTNGRPKPEFLNNPPYDYSRDRHEFMATPGTSGLYENTPGTSRDSFEATPGTSKDMNEATSGTSRNSELQETPGNASGKPEPEADTDSD